MQVNSREATKVVPNSMGSYKLYYNGLTYVGKAEDGIQKRFVQYYNGTFAHYSSVQKIFQDCDQITVSWQLCQTREEVRALEVRWMEQFQPKWNKQSGWRGY